EDDRGDDDRDDREESEELLLGLREKGREREQDQARGGQHQLGSEQKPVGGLNCQRPAPAGSAATVSTRGTEAMAGGVSVFPETARTICSEGTRRTSKIGRGYSPIQNAATTSGASVNCSRIERSGRA